MKDYCLHCHCPSHHIRAFFPTPSHPYLFPFAIRPRFSKYENPLTSKKMIDEISFSIFSYAKIKSFIPLFRVYSSIFYFQFSALTDLVLLQLGRLIGQPAHQSLVNLNLSRYLHKHRLSWARYQFTLNFIFDIAILLFEFKGSCNDVIQSKTISKKVRRTCRRMIQDVRDELGVREASASKFSRRRKGTF